MSLNVNVLERSFKLVAPQGEKLVARFYERLFQKYPAVKPLFKHSSMKAQKNKLLASLVLVIQNLRHPDKLTVALQDLGSRHVPYGALPAHYDAVGENLLAVLEEFAGPAWTPGVKQAWIDAYGAIKTIMLAGAQRASYTQGGRTMGRGKKKEATSGPDMGTLCMTALDNSQTNVLMCDRNLVVTYINKTAQKKLKDLESEIKQLLPSFNADAIVGTCIDGFHKDPSKQRRILADPANLPYKADVQLGPLTLSLTVSAITSQTGEYLGNTLEWEDVTEKRKMEKEMFVVRTSLDDANSNVLMCDRNLLITYVNNTALKKLRTLETEIRKVLPAFDTNKLVGTCIDSFHKMPSHQRRILDDPKSLPYRGDIQLGPLTLELIVTAITSKDGEYLGNTLEWTDVTAKRKADTEMARLKASLDSARSNVLVCDRTYTIVYANPASVSTLRLLEGEIRKVMPGFAVDKVIGSCIDQYHKNPSHQRQLLDNPKNLPYRAEIKLGPLTLDLAASAIMSEKGEYLGNVVEWADITAQNRAQTEVQRLISAAVDGKLSERAPAESFDGFYRSLAEGINNMLDALVDRLTKVVGAVKTATESVSTGSGEISQGTEDLSQRTSEQASALEETSSAMEEMTSTVKQNADNAKQANQLAAAARDVAEQGGHVTTRAIVAMDEINKSSKKIADIITVIDEIAFQTNLLALNAAVEAARAGEQGRGFAVVAAEVRNLAQRSATAAKEIKGLINESVQKVSDGSSLVTQCGKTLEEIVSSVKRVADIVSEISAASQEQTTGIEQTNKAIMQMDETTQQNAALVEESAAACQTLAAQSQRLMGLMESFKIRDGRVAEMAAIEEHAEEAPVAKAAKKLSPAASSHRPQGAQRRTVVPAKVGAGVKKHEGTGRHASENEFEEF